jgi:hypothetical protein
MRREVVKGGEKPIWLGKIRITERGRQALVNVPLRRSSPKLP